jgi:hypothetical protein
MSLEPVSDEGLSLGARRGRTHESRSPADFGGREPSLLLWWSALKCSSAPVEIDANYLPHAPIAPACGHGGVTSQEWCATDRPETVSPIQHRPARALERAAGRAGLG